MILTILTRAGMLSSLLAIYYNIAQQSKLTWELYKAKNKHKDSPLGLSVELPLLGSDLNLDPTDKISTQVGNLEHAFLKIAEKTLILNVVASGILTLGIAHFIDSNKNEENMRSSNASKAIIWSGITVGHLLYTKHIRNQLQGLPNFTPEMSLQPLRRFSL